MPRQPPQTRETSKARQKAADKSSPTAPKTSAMRRDQERTIPTAQDDARSGRRARPLGASLFDRFLWTGLSPLDQSVWAPQVETLRRGDTFVVRADLPGMKKSDVKVEIDTDVLTVSGERRAEHEESGDGFFRSERTYGRFYRAIPLPATVTASEVNATFKDGVLEVTFPAPKRSDSRAQSVEIR